MRAALKYTTYIFYTGVVTISPSPRAAVCRAGDTLKLTCNTTASVLMWELTFARVTDSFTTTLTSTASAEQRFAINSTTFVFLRTSRSGKLPLISTLMITPVSNHHNGSQVTCREAGSSTTAMAATTVYIVGDNQGE